MLLTVRLLIVAGPSFPGADTATDFTPSMPKDGEAANAPLPADTRPSERASELSSTFIFMINSSL
ncbi:hypothetical protein D3C81_2210310 [compost metagenome]